ncbi:pyridoxal phosphate-dependent aminotransferase [Amycolatopsis sp. NPDC059021]|uniref:pyridoxal phosphate-dependent aminotransferase n=1 Tax=Amycolatopsis sp. NPDC059021 TaxID=3346704 RepID=UPI00366B3F8A
MSTTSLAVPPAVRSPRAGQVPASCLHQVFRAARARELDKGGEVIKLFVGDPYFSPPAVAAEALSAAALRGETRYTAVEGLPELREALVDKLAVENKIDTAATRVFVTPGSTQGLTALLRSLADPGAEILLPELHWPVHVQQALLAGVRPVFYRLGAGYRPEPEDVLAAAGPRTKVLMLNSPSNPTGAVLEAERITRLLRLAREQGWQVISDEAYEHYVYEGEHLSVAAFERDTPVAERIVHSVFSFSKSAAMTGYRLGYVVTADEATAAAMQVVQEAGILAPPTPVQHAGLAVLREPGSYARNRELVRHNRDTVLPRLIESGLLAELPAGGWYAVLDVTTSGLDAGTFAARLLDRHGVAVVPGAGFALQPTFTDDGELRPVTSAPWARSLVRIAFCGDPGRLAEGVGKITEFATESLGDQ